MNDRLREYLNLNLTKEEAEQRIFEMIDNGEVPIMVEAFKNEFKASTFYETREMLKQVLAERDRLDTIELLNLCKEEMKRKKLDKWLKQPVRLINGEHL